jgi:hypothetical protein
MLRSIKRIVGVVPNAISDSVIEFHRLLDGIFGSFESLRCMTDNHPVVTVDHPGWSEIFCVQITTFFPIWPLLAVGSSGLCVPKYSAFSEAFHPCGVYSQSQSLALPANLVAQSATISIGTQTMKIECFVYKKSIAGRTPSRQKMPVKHLDHFSVDL